MSRLFGRRRGTASDKEQAGMPSSTSSSSLGSAGEGGGGDALGVGTKLAELKIPANDFRGSVIISSLSNRFSILRSAASDASPSTASSGPHSAPTRAGLSMSGSTASPISIADIRARLAKQRQLAGEATGKQWFVTEEEEELVLEELAGTGLAASTAGTKTPGLYPQAPSPAMHSAPIGGDFRKSPSDWSLQSGASEEHAAGGISRSQSASSVASGTRPTYDDPRDPRRAGAAASGSKPYSSGSSALREREIMRAVKQSKSRQNLTSPVKDKDLDSAVRFPPAPAPVSPPAESWVPPVAPRITRARADSGARHDEAAPASAPPTRSSTQRRSLLDGLGPAAIKRISMALVEIEEELAAMRPPAGEAPADVEQLAYERSPPIPPLQFAPRRPIDPLGPTTPGHFRKTSITRSPAFHEALAEIAANRQAATPDTSPSTNRIARSQSDRAANLPRISSRTQRHLRQASHSPLPSPPLSAPVRPTHDRSFSESATNDWSPLGSREGTPSPSAMPISRESILHGYTPGAARPYTPPRQLAGMVTSRKAEVSTAREGPSRLQLSIRPGLPPPLAHSLSSSGVPTVSPVVEHFENRVGEDGAHLSSDPRRTADYGPSTATRQPWALRSLAPQETPGDEGDVSFNPVSYYGGRESPPPPDDLDLADTSRRASTASIATSMWDEDSFIPAGEREWDHILSPSLTSHHPDLVQAAEYSECWDVPERELLVIQAKLVASAKGVRSFMSGDVASPDPSARAGPLFVGQAFSRRPSAASSPAASSLSTPALHRQPTSSSTASSAHARTPSSAQDHSYHITDPHTSGRFASPVIEQHTSPSSHFASPIISRHSKDSPHSPASADTVIMAKTPQTMSPNLADDPVFRKQFEEKIASATADLSRNVSTSRLTRKNTRSKANNISSPKLISSSAKHLPTTPIAGPSGKGTVSGGLDGHPPNAGRHIEMSPTASSPATSSPSTSRLRSFASLRRPNRSLNKSQTEIPQPPVAGPKELHRNASSSFRTLVGRLRSHKTVEPAFVPVAPTQAKQSAANDAPFLRQRPLEGRRPVESVVRRTVILPQTWETPLAVNATPETPARKPSTRRKPVQRTPSVTLELASRQSGPEAEEQQPPSTADSASDYQQDSAGSLVDMYLDDRAADEEDLEVQDGVEICEMSDGQVIWNIREQGKTVEQHRMSVQQSAATSTAFQLLVKAAQPRAHSPAPIGRPETKVYFSSMTQMADLIDDLSKDLDSGRFDILPSTEGLSAVQPLQQQTAPPIPVSSRLQALLNQHLGPGVSR